MMGAGTAALPGDGAGDVRVVELLAALSLTTDLASGMPFEKGLRVCLVADRLAGRLGLPPTQRAGVFHTALLRSIGCTSHAPENARLFVDDTAFQAVLRRLDPADPVVFGAQLADFGRWTDHGPELARRFLEVAPSEGPAAATGACELSRALVPAFGVGTQVVRALEHVYERWDGQGIPAGRRGDELALETRILHVAEQAVLADAEGGVSAAETDLRRRAGGHLDPRVAAAAGAGLRDLLAACDGPDLLQEVTDREPPPRRTVEASDVPRLCSVLGLVADLKSLHLLGHSQHVAELAADAAVLGDLAAVEVERVRRAGLLHNLGAAVVPSSVLDARPETTGTAGREWLRLQSHWTCRILQRCPSLAGLEMLSRTAAAHHASYADARYVSWKRPAELPAVSALTPGQAVLEAAEAFAASTEPRPGRPAMSTTQAAAQLRSAAVAGLLRSEELELVAAAALHKPVRRRRGDVPDGPGLTEREVEVLRLTAQGLSNREIAGRLRISDRTVGHHLAHVYDKTGRRTRAGVAVWAVERGLLPSPT